MSQEPGKIVFVMPRVCPDHVRAVHKQAYALSQAGYDVVLVVKASADTRYLGMPVVVASAPYEGLLRPLLNLPSLFRQVRRLNGSAYVLRNPDTILIALLLKLAGHTVFYDTHEDFSKRPLIHDPLPVWSRRLAAITITAFERLLARCLDGVIVTQAQQPAFLGGRTLLLPNAPLVNGPVHRDAQRAGMTGSRPGLRLLYVGVITRRRGIAQMLDLVARLNAESVECSLDLVGHFDSEALLEAAKQHPGWRFTHHHGWVPHASALASMRSADIGFAILDPAADVPTSSITKLYEYMEAGLPFIASDFAAWHVDTPGGRPGFYVDPEDDEAIYAAAVALASEPVLRERMGAAGRWYVANEFNWDIMAERFIDYIEETLASRAEVGRQNP